MRLHVVGASGSGTSTLGAALAAAEEWTWFDTDDFYWAPTEPRFLEKRPVEERLRLLGAALEGAADWVLTGSMISWGAPLVPRFEAVVYLYVPPEARMGRLLAREEARYGQNGPDLEFLAWARSYDDTGFSGRSRHGHEAWLETLDCPVLRIEGPQPTSESLKGVQAWLRAHV